MLSVVLGVVFILWASTAWGQTRGGNGLEDLFSPHERFSERSIRGMGYYIYTPPSETKKPDRPKQEGFQRKGIEPSVPDFAKKRRFRVNPEASSGNTSSTSVRRNSRKTPVESLDEAFREID